MGRVEQAMFSLKDRLARLREVEEGITEVGRPFSVRLRASPEAVGERQSGLMLHALSYCESSHSKD